MEQHEQQMIHFGTNLRAERERQRLTRIALANKIGTKQDYIAQIERGSKSPSMKTLRRIVEALNVSADSLIFGTDESERDSVKGTLNELIGLLERKSVEDINALADIVKFISARVKVS